MKSATHWPVHTAYQTASTDNAYRYELARIWGDRAKVPNLLGFVMLNPSTANSAEDDPTIRRCMGFARRDNFDGIAVFNLYGLRATKPKHLWESDDPEGPENLATIKECLPRTVVCAWGASVERAPQLAFVYQMLRNMRGPSLEHDFWTLGTTAGGHPRHPLYVRADTALEPWDGAL